MRHFDLLLDADPVLLEELQEAKFDRRADSGGIGLQPGTRIIEITPLQRTRLRRGSRQRLQDRDGRRPGEEFVVALVPVLLETAVTRRVAAGMVQVLDGPRRNAMELLRRARQISRAPKCRIDEVRLVSRWRWRSVSASQGASRTNSTSLSSSR